MGDITTLLRAISDAKNDRVIEKFESVLKKDADFHRLKTVGGGASTDPLSHFKTYFNYACIISIDVKRATSRCQKFFLLRKYRSVKLL